MFVKVKIIFISSISTNYKKIFFLSKFKTSLPIYPVAPTSNIIFFFGIHSINSMIFFPMIINKFEYSQLIILNFEKKMLK